MKSVQITARDFEAIRAGKDLIDLLHPFWSFQEISDGFNIKEDWGVADDLIPFYGDWHTLICISRKTGEIFLLNDERAPQFVWNSIDDFLGGLTHELPSESEPLHRKPMLINATLSDELTKLIEQATREDTHRNVDRND